MSERIAAVVVAAGSSRRMNGRDKLWIEIDGVPVLGHTIAALSLVDEISQIVVVTSVDSVPRLAVLRTSTPWSAISAVVEGGAERADSVYAGLAALQPCDLVLIHDGARPCVAPDLVRRGIVAAREIGAAIPALPVTDTIKAVDERGLVVATPDRAALRAVQTPQIFRYELLLRAYTESGAARASCTDDAMLVERLGQPVGTFLGDPRNIKVSTPADLALVQLYLRQVREFE